jgi:hypothetical protein
MGVDQGASIRTPTASKMEIPRDSRFQFQVKESVSVCVCEVNNGAVKLRFHIEMRPVGFAPHREGAHVT